MKGSAFPDPAEVLRIERTSSRSVGRDVGIHIAGCVVGDPDGITAIGIHRIDLVVALEKLIPLIYAELQRAAQRYMARERR